MICSGFILQVNGEEIIEVLYTEGKCSTYQMKGSANLILSKGSFPYQSSSYSKCPNNSGNKEILGIGLTCSYSVKRKDCCSKK